MLNLLLIISNSLVDKISNHMDGEIAQAVRSRDHFMPCKHKNLSWNLRNQIFVKIQIWFHMHVFATLGRQISQYIHDLYVMYKRFSTGISRCFHSFSAKGASLSEI